MVLASIILLLSINLVFALDTQLDIKTSATAPLTIRFQDVDGSGTLENGAFIDQIKNSEGIISVTFSSDLENYVKISVGGNGISYKYFRDVKTGWIYSIDLSQSDPQIIQEEKTATPANTETPTEPPIEETPTETPTPVVEETPIETPTPSVEETPTETEETSKITGAAILKKAMPILKKVAYIAIIIFGGLILIASFLFVKKKKSKTATSAIKFREKFDDSKEDGELEDAERKIKEAEAEIKDIKDRKSELKEAKRKFEEDKQKLRELRQRENQN